MLCMVRTCDLAKLMRRTRLTKRYLQAIRAGTQAMPSTLTDALGFEAVTVYRRKAE